MSRTFKDRPFRVKEAHALKIGKAREVDWVNWGRSYTPVYPSRVLSKSILKGDVDSVKNYREYLATLDGYTVVEKEIKVPLYTLSNVVPSNDCEGHGDTLFQHRSFEHAKELEDEFPFCQDVCTRCWARPASSRKMIHFEVTPAPFTRETTVETFIELDRGVHFYRGRGGRYNESARGKARTRERAALHNLKYSASIEEDWDDHVDLVRNENANHWFF